MMLLFCKKTTSRSFDPFFSFLCRGGSLSFCGEEGAFLFVKTGRSLLFRLKKSKKVDDVALPQPSFGEKEKKRLDEISVLTTLHKVNARAF